MKDVRGEASVPDMAYCWEWSPRCLTQRFPAANKHPQKCFCNSGAPGGR